MDPYSRKMLIPVQLNDSITGNLMFDTGGSMIFDSSFCALHPQLSFYNNENKAKRMQSRTAWRFDAVPSLVHDTLQTIKIGDITLEYSPITVYNLKNYMNNDALDGIFNIPLNDTIHIWELNFEQNYLSVISIDDFVMPENCLLLPIVEYFYAGRIRVQLPMQIQCSDGDILTMNHNYLVDTGISEDIAIMHHAEEEQEFFNKRNDAIWTLDGMAQHYTVKAILFDEFIVDSLRIYTFPPNDVRDKYLIGLNFLKRFNVFFDLKNRQIGLQPIKNFQRIYPNARRFHISIDKTQEGKFIVKIVADYKANYYKTAGMQEGDEIVALNSIPFKNITSEDLIKFHEQEDSLIYDVIRNGQALKIIVFIDKSEEQGDI
jgi:hypothetical protein